MSVASFSNGYALLIGVAEDTDPLARTVVADANALGELLVGAGYRAANVQTLTSSAATRDGILAALEELAARVAQDDAATAVVFYSGHGLRVSTADATHYCLCPRGFDAQRPLETGLTGKEFSALVQQVQAKRLLVLLDCCHAGGMSKSASGAPERAFPGDILEGLSKGQGRIVMAACGPDELSWVLPECRNSLFTDELLRALRGAAASADGSVRVLQIIKHLIDEVKQREPLQHPFFRAEDLNDDFAVCIASAPRPTPSQEDVMGAERETRALLTQLAEANAAATKRWAETEEARVKAVKTAQTAEKAKLKAEKAKLKAEKDAKEARRNARLHQLKAASAWVVGLGVIGVCARLLLNDWRPIPSPPVPVVVVHPSAASPAKPPLPASSLRPLLRPAPVGAAATSTGDLARPRVPESEARRALRAAIEAQQPR